MTRATFPGDPLPIRVEILINGTWTNVTSYVRRDAEIFISARGKASEQGTYSPTTCEFALNNRDGRFVNKNPNSPYFGQLPFNIPVRVSVTEDRSFAVLTSDDGSYVHTSDKASLDITGDIDVRIEYEPVKYTGDDGMILASKYLRTGSDNRSWALLVSKNGYPILRWTTDGTSGTIIDASCTVPLDMSVTPTALRATLDVNNGSGGYTATFYTSTTISDSWTQLGSPVVTTAGTTSIFSGTADLEIGRIDNGLNFGITGFEGLSGRVYGFELYNGIGGTLVANAAIYSRSRGDLVWSDGLASANTWLVSLAEVSPDDFRFYGEIAALPIEADISGSDVYVPIQAADVTRRYGKSGTVIKSALASYFDAYITSESVTGYWKCEDGAQATTLANSNPRGVPGTFGDVSFGTPSDLPASAGAVTINSTSSYITLTGRTFGNTGNTCFNWAAKMPSVPAGSTTMLNLTAIAGTVGRVNMSVTATTFDLAAYDTDGALITSNSTLWTATTSPDHWLLYRIQMQQVGANVQLDIGWYHPGDGVLYGAGALVFAGTAGRFFQCQIAGSTGNVGTQFAHFFQGQFFLDNTTTDYVQAASAFNGETTAARWTRVCSQNDIDGVVVGSTDACEVMNVQPIDTPLNVLYACVDTERSVAYPDRSSAALVFRTRASLMNQYGPTVSHTGGDLGPPRPKPANDDGLLRNAVTAVRSDGSTGYATQDTGPNSTALPTATPPGAGIVPGKVSADTYLSERLQDIAAEDVFLGTWDEPRWPAVPVLLERSPYTGTAAKIRRAHTLSRLDVGDLLTISDLPSYMSPDSASLMIRGMTEVLGNRTWRITWNTSQYGPYIANNLTSSAASRYRVAAGNAGYVLSGSTLTTTGTTFDVVIPTYSKTWGDSFGKPNNFPINVVIGGEVITVGAISTQGSLIIDDGTFEDGVTHWNAQPGANASLVQSNTHAYSGTYAGLLTVTSGTPAQVYSRQNSGYAPPVTVGTSYTASMYVYSDTAIATMTCSIDWLTSGGVYISTSSASVSLTANTWTRITASGNAPATAAFASFGPTIGGSPAVGVRAWFDNADFGPTVRGTTQHFWVDARSVNGIIKAHDIGDAVEVQYPFYTAL